MRLPPIPQALYFEDIDWVPDSFSFHTIMTATFKKSPQIVERKIRGEHLLVPLMGTADQLDSLYTLNPTAGFVWELAGQGLPLPDIARRLVDAFNVDFETAQQDITRIINELVAIHALEPVET